MSKKWSWKYCVQRTKKRKKEGLTSVSPSRDDVGDALSTQKETNYASHAESPNRDPEESHTRCRVKIQNTDRGRGRSEGGKGDVKFADDQGMVAGTETGLQKIMESLKATAEKYGMKITIEETKVYNEGIQKQ